MLPATSNVSGLPKLRVQEGEGSLPRQGCGCGVVGIRAIGLKEPVRGSRIGIERERPARCLEFLLQLRDRLRWLEGVMFCEVAEVGRRSFAEVQTSVCGVKDDDGGNLRSQGD